MTFFSRFYTISSLLVGILIVAYLFPIWLFDYFPTQDGVSHVYNSQIITEYNNPTFQFGDYYNINWFPFPNWLSHFCLALLMFIFKPLTAEKVFLSLYVILFPIAIRYFLKTVQSGKDSLVILSFTFIYNYLLLMGFLQLCCQCPLILFSTGFLVETQGRVEHNAYCPAKPAHHRHLFCTSYFLCIYPVLYCTACSDSFQTQPEADSYHRVRCFACGVIAARLSPYFRFIGRRST